MTALVVVGDIRDQNKQQAGTYPMVKQQTYMAQLILKMQDCLSQLGVNTDTDFCLQRMERMAILIHESMSLSSRNYHSVQHVFDICLNLTDPLCILAALFHDCVYFHVDGGLSQRQQDILKGAVLMVTNSDQNGVMSGCQLQPSSYEQDPLLHMVVMIFNYQPNTVITPMMGVNEFLSAVIAVRELEPLLKPPYLAEIAACIEATVPFRPTNAEGSPMDRLFAHICHANAQLGRYLNMKEEQIVQAVQRAVLMTNEDVGNFGTDDPGWFLDNTWNLLPEGNVPLRHPFLYTCHEFSFAVFKMYGFFQYVLQPGIIFQNFRGVPSPEEFARRVKNAGRNIEVGRKYLSAKLLSSSVVSAFAELTGGDAPLSLFMGDMPTRNRMSQRLEDSLPRFNEQDLKGCDLIVYRLLSQGRKSDSSFDIRQSPLAAYLYAYLGDAGMDQILKDSTLKIYPMSREVAVSLLQRFPRSTMVQVAENIAVIARSRSSRIRKVVEDLPEEK